MRQKFLAGLSNLKFLWKKLHWVPIFKFFESFKNAILGTHKVFKFKSQATRNFCRIGYQCYMYLKVCIRVAEHTRKKSSLQCRQKSFQKAKRPLSAKMGTRITFLKLSKNLKMGTKCNFFHKVFKFKSPQKQFFASDTNVLGT